MEVISCLDCKKPTNAVLDHGTGDTICTECGLVLDSHFIDEKSEWRTFADSSDDKDPSRVGGQTNPLLANGGGLTTVIKNPNPDDKRTKRLVSTSFRVEKNPDQALNRAFQVIAEMTEKLWLNEMIKTRACQIFSKLEEKKSCRNKRLICLCAGCIFMACRELRFSRTLKEISTVAEGASVKDINRACVAIKGSVEIEAHAVNTGELVRRFCSNIGMSHQVKTAVEEATQRSEMFDIRRSPKSVLAAIIFMITQLSGDEKRPLQDISVATGVAETTIKKSYKDIHPYASCLVPKWFANEEDVKSLTSP